MTDTHRLLRLKDVLKLTGLSATTIWRKENSGIFPGRIKLGENSVAWLENEVADWIDAKILARDSTAPVLAQNNVEGVGYE
jgi:prophage regulatory protein